MWELGEVGIFSREILQLLEKYAQSLEELYLGSLPMGIFLRNYGTFLEMCALLEIQAHSRDFCKGDYMGVWCICMYNNGVWGYASPGNFLKNQMLWDWFWGHFRTKAAIVVVYATCRAREVILAVHVWPCMHLHLLSQLTSNFHERRYYSWQNSRWGVWYRWLIKYSFHIENLYLSLLGTRVS